MVEGEIQKGEMGRDQRKGGDGWMEAELGELYNESCCDDISGSVVETESPYWKRGLIIQGFEFRPVKTQ